MHEAPGEKTEQPTPRRLEEAFKRGQFARSPEVQTVFVLLSGLGALWFTGREIWETLMQVMGATVGHLNDVPLTVNAMQGYVVNGSFTLGQCVWPVLAATAVSGLLAGGIQSRFHATPDVLEANWERLNPVTGFQRVFSARAAAPTGIALLKLLFIIGLAYGVIRSILSDPVFYTSVDVASIARFMANSGLRLLLRIGLALLIIAALDYAYQCWRTHRDLMMTKEEVKEETKNTEGNQQVRAAQRRQRRAITQRKMLLAVPQADVVVTNPTHLAIALRYDRKAMRAPKVVAKGSRLNALRIREIARQHQVPLVENKPLARLLFKYGKVGSEIPVQFYQAVAELLAYVYRINAYRYYREQHLAPR